MAVIFWPEVKITCLIDIISAVFSNQSMRALSVQTLYIFLILFGKCSITFHDFLGLFVVKNSAIHFISKLLV